VTVIRTDSSGSAVRSTVAPRRQIGGILGDEEVSALAAPVEIVELRDFALRRPYTVDTLFELPETDFRFEVLEGQLVVSPAATPEHASILEQLFMVLRIAVPKELRLLQGAAVRLPNDDGPIPDLLLTSSTAPREYARGLPHWLVHTVVEVVSPSNADNDRVTKTRLYAEAKIPCYWRIEPRTWKEYSGPVPAIVVRRVTGGRWRQTVAPAGTEARLPVVIDRKGTTVIVTIDPATLAA
jgi:Uma2 family endonuclease